MIPTAAHGRPRPAAAGRFKRDASRLSSKLPRDPVRIALFGFVLISISRAHQQFGFIAALRPGLLLFGAAVGFAFLNPKLLALPRLTATWPPRAMIAFGFCTVFAAFFGLSLGGSAVFMMEDFSKTFISTLLIIAAIRSVSDLRFFLWAYALSMGFWVYTGFFRLNLSSAYGSATMRLGHTGMGFDANDLGLIITMGIPMLLVLFGSSKIRGRVLAIAILLGSAMLLARTGSRGALVGLASVLATLLITTRSVSVPRRVAVALVAIGALTVAAPPGYWQQMESLLNMEEDYNMTDEDGRMQLIKRGMGYVAQYPIFGLGPANFGRAEGTISEKARNHVPGTGILWAAPHNTYLQVVTETGLVGFAVWMYLLIRCFREAFRIRKRIPRSWATGSYDDRFLYHFADYFPALLVGFCVPALFVSFAYLAPFYLLVAFATAFFSMTEERLSERARARAHRRAAATALRRPATARTP